MFEKKKRRNVKKKHPKKAPKRYGKVGSVGKKKRREKVEISVFSNCLLTVVIFLFNILADRM